jgi:hypothetical protein
MDDRSGPNSLSDAINRLDKLRHVSAVDPVEFQEFKAILIAQATAVPSARLLDEVEHLAQLKQSGLLTDAEFEQAKSRVTSGKPTTSAAQEESRSQPRPFGYIYKILIPGEEIVLTSSVSLVAMLWKLVLGVPLAAFGLLTLNSTAPWSSSIMLAIGVILIWGVIFQYLTNHLILTNRRLIAKTGFIALNTVETKLDKIESINIQQTFIGRLLNYGHLRCTGTGGSIQSFPSIDGPTRFKRDLDTTLDRLKMKNR